MVAPGSLERFVGRTRELTLLRTRLEQALGGTGGLVFLSAEPGAGKTTLTSRFLDDVARDHPEAIVIRATCSEQYGAGEPYQPFVEAFRHLLHEREGRRGRSFRDIAKQLAPYWVAAIPVAGEVIAASLVTATELKQEFRGGSRPGAASEEALFFQYSELFFAAAVEAPLVLFLDDLHWADRASVSLLTHLGRRAGDQRVLIVGTYRPAEIDAGRHPMRDARQELQRYRVAEELTLEPLDSDALAQLVQLHTGASPSRQLFDWLEQSAGTNALFFEELLSWLTSQGFTRENRGELQLLRVPQEIEIPRSAESTIEKRLDRLDEDTRRVLEYASVQGNEFDSVSLARLLEMDELELEEALEPIARTHRLIRLTETRDLPNGDIASVYRFSHSLIQEVLHRSLQGKRRILLHRKMAQIIEELYAGDALNVAARLAIHFEEGRQAEKAFEYALIAGERASRVYAHWDALQQIKRALRNAGTREREAEAWQRLAEEYIAIAQYNEALQALTEAERRIEAAAEPARALRLRHRMLSVEAMQGVRPLDDLLTAMEALRARAHELGEPAEECQIIWHMIDLPATTESMDVELAREALGLAERSGNLWLTARGHEVLGLALAFGIDPAAAMDELQRAAQLFAELGDRAREAGARNNLSLARVFLGDFQNAAVEFAATMRIFDEIVDPMRGAVSRSNLGALLRILGDFEEAEARLREAIRIFERLDGSVRVVSPLMNLAELHETRGEWSEAESCWQQMLERAREAGYRGEQVIAQCGIGTARLRRGDLAGALEAERSARTLLGPDLDSESGEALQLFSARLASATGEHEAAAAMLERLEASLIGRDRYLAAVHRLERAQVLRPIQPALALQLARDARDVFADVGARPLLEQADTFVDTLLTAEGR